MKHDLKHINSVVHVTIRLTLCCLLVTLALLMGRLYVIRNWWPVMVALGTDLIFSSLVMIIGAYKQHRDRHIWSARNRDDR